MFSDDNTGLLRSGQESYTVLGHAFLQARYRTAIASLYRQEIDIPFLNRDDSRMAPNAFQAYLLTAEDSFGIEGLKFGGGHVTKVKGRTSSDFVSMSELAGVDGVERGVSVVGARYEIAEGVTVGGSDQYGWDIFNTSYGEGHMKHKFPGTDITTKSGLQITDQRSVGDELLGSFDTQMYGGTMSVDLKGFLATIGVTTTENGSRVRNPWGGNELEGERTREEFRVIVNYSIPF